MTAVSLATRTFTVADVRKRWRCVHEPNFAITILRDFQSRGFVELVGPGEYAVTALVARRVPTGAKQRGRSCDRQAPHGARAGRVLRPQPEHDLDRFEAGDLSRLSSVGRKGGPVRFRLSEIERALAGWRFGTVGEESSAD